MNKHQLHLSSDHMVWFLLHRGWSGCGQRRMAVTLGKTVFEEDMCNFPIFSQAMTSIVLINDNSVLGLTCYSSLLLLFLSLWNNQIDLNESLSDQHSDKSNKPCSKQIWNNDQHVYNCSKNKPIIWHFASVFAWNDLLWLRKCSLVSKWAYFYQNQPFLVVFLL